MDDIVVEGNYVVLMKSFDSGNMKIIPAIRDTTVHYGKLHFSPSPLIGAKFGSVFEIKDETMHKIENFEAYDDQLSAIVTEKLSTFNEKSQFSQEKIIKKKKKQNHSNIVTVIQPTLLLINEMLYARDKLGGLRMDALSQILTSANIQNGTRCLLLDHSLGLVTSAVMSRNLPQGMCIQLLPDNEATCTTRRTLNMLNIMEKDCEEKLVSITIRDLYKIHKCIDRFSHETNLIRAKTEERLERLSHYATRTIRDEETGEKISVELTDSEKKNLLDTLMKKHRNRILRHEERLKAASYLKPWSIDSIILITQHDDPLTLLKLLFKFLAPSRQFVVYCDSIQPLLECHQYLKTQSLAVSLSLSDTWLRRYQVLPDRTRPEMNISGYGGYLLSGTKALTGQKSGEIADYI